LPARGQTDPRADSCSRRVGRSRASARISCDRARRGAGDCRRDRAAARPTTGEAFLESRGDRCSVRHPPHGSGVRRHPRAMRVKPRVLMVTGAYYPELSGGGLQARRVVHALRDAVDFSILTTSVDPRLPAVASEDGVAIRRIMVVMTSVVSTLTAGVRLASAF